jgi:AraC family transcriptional activator of pyochelin receptor
LEVVVTLTLSAADYWALWQEEYLFQEFCSPPQALCPPSEAVEICPKDLGVGRRRWIALRNIDLLIHDYEFYEAVQIHYPAEETGCLEFGFQLQGGSYAHRYAGQNFVQNGPQSQEIVREQPGEHILQVDIHLESAAVLRSFLPYELDQFPDAIQRLLQASTQQPYLHVSKTTDAMQLVLNQVLHCPYQGLTKQIYLEGKCWELIALRLEQLNLDGNTSYPVVLNAVDLKTDDIDRIHEAKAILTQNWQTPPSLPELARQVGLNDYKLKLGFRQVFGTTAFGYLWHYRMEQARQLLAEGRHNVKEVSTMVGYAKQSNFAAAFRKKFGLNPKAYQFSQTLSHKRSIHQSKKSV